MDYMIRFTQVHKSFCIPELKALAVLENINLVIQSYSSLTPFCLVQVPSPEAAARLVKRSILAKAAYEVWGQGNTYEQLYEDTGRTSQHLWPLYKSASFKFSFDSFQSSRTIAEQRKIIEGFRFLGFNGPIRMKGAEQEFCICENWELDAGTSNIQALDRVYFVRFLGAGGRDIINKYDLKKRNYICTTSMDAELTLITANITLAASGKLFYDPFVGSGSLPVACAHFGALVFGSDIDGRSIRGKGETNLLANFAQYELVDCFGDSFVADLTHSPMRATKIFDGIVCDPPYGVREGLKVLGSRDPTKGKEPVFKNGTAHHTMDSYIPPKRPYSFLAMLDDILDFAAQLLVDNGRLSLWMPTANDADQEIKIPQHPHLQVVSVCTQAFNKWSRRLITYQRLPDDEIAVHSFPEKRVTDDGISADELNPFRKGYFKGFKPVVDSQAG